MIFIKNFTIENNYPSHKEINTIKIEPTMGRLFFVFNSQEELDSFIFELKASFKLIMQFVLTVSLKHVDCKYNFYSSDKI